MKRRYINYTAAFLLGIGALASCKKSFLEHDPKGQYLEVNYYANPTQALAGLVAAYDPLSTESGGMDNTYTNPLGPLNSASDDCYAGGGSSSDQGTWQAVSDYNLLTPATGPQGSFWSIYFTGVNRCNTILQKLENVPGLSEADKKRYIAEARFLRAHYYFDLLRLFKNIPLIITPIDAASIYEQNQVNPKDVYAQIEADLKAATETGGLPATVPADQNGRATLGAGKALLGKVYLYENKWTDAATVLKEVNGEPGGTSGYGYHLQSNFGNIFSPDNKFNSESIFEITHSGNQKYDWGNWNQFKSNIYVQMVGPRGYSGPVYWGGGWGFNPVTTQLANAMKGDPRYGYTIVNIDSLTKATGTNYQGSYQNTGYFINKYAPLKKYQAASTPELNFPNNYIEIRLADTYLMEAEALVQSGSNMARAGSLLNAVRARVGLPAIAATLDNIYNERRMELAIEGHRWFDLVRTGKAAQALAFKHFKAGTNDLLPIPLRDFNNTKLVQNPGY